MKVSIRSIERKYAKMLLDYKDVDFKKKINNYVCTVCGVITKTVDINKGVTPFIARCKVCREEARSTFYKDLVPEENPTTEFYRPDLKETIKLRDKPSQLEHVLMGGLLTRKIEDNGTTGKTN